jgi:cytoplasmic iron level regulating protein YaaA (DUF328/UPF0246 family)
MADPQRTIYLVSCVSKKRQTTCAARDLYISDWFVKARNYVESTGSPWFILSAKYGVVTPNEQIKTYNLTLNKMNVRDRRAWAERVRLRLDDLLPPVERIVVLAGRRYRELLMEYLLTRAGKVCVPMRGMSIGRQLHYLKEARPQTQQASAHNGHEPAGSLGML